MTTPCWIVGRGGLLGGHVERSLVRAVTPVALWRCENDIRWQDPEQAVADLQREAAAFFRQVARTGNPWRLLWCAGAGVVATSPTALAEESAVLARFLADLADRFADDGALARSGTLFFASSAGGVYSASTAERPFDEFSPVGALGPYGQEKLAQEERFAQLARSCAVDLLIGRLSNLYGPGQKLTKPQGLIAHVGRAALRREPISIYVPLDTIRDYLFAPDAARMIVAAVERREAARRHGAPHETITKIFASEVETTVAAVLGTWRRVLRRPLRVAFASSLHGRLQPRVLSFRSQVYRDLRGQPTLLPVGIDAVRRDQLTRLLATGLG